DRMCPDGGALGQVLVWHPPQGGTINYGDPNNWRIGGTAMPLRGTETTGVSAVAASVSDGDPGAAPRWAAARWCNHTVLRNDGLPGWGAAVRKTRSAAWPPSTSGWLTPENTVSWSRCFSRSFRYGVSS